MANQVRDSFNPAFPLAAIDHLADLVLDKKTRSDVDPIKLWESGLAENVRIYVDQRWGGGGKRQNAITRRVNTLLTSMRSIRGYEAARWQISRVWRITYRGDNYWDRPTVGHVACRTPADAADLGMVKYTSVILCYTNQIDRARLGAEEVCPGDWDAARQRNMEIIVRMNEQIKEKQAGIQKIQAEVDKLTNARLYALEGLHVV
jgi:hypothetical protein